MILQSENIKTQTIAHITTDENTIYIRFPEKREDFRKIVKRLGYCWQYPCWVRDVEIRHDNGTIEDRIVETCCILLDAGFRIICPDDTTQTKVVLREFEPECRRWIYAVIKGNYEGWFSLSWLYGDDLYKQARRITASKYNKPNVVVPAEYYAEVLDFAEIHSFQFTEAAQKLIQKAQEEEATAITLPRQHISIMSKTLGVPESTEIADELKDEPL